VSGHRPRARRGHPGGWCLPLPRQEDPVVHVDSGAPLPTGSISTTPASLL
jgi:hypothetical protein